MEKFINLNIFYLNVYQLQFGKKKFPYNFNMMKLDYLDNLFQIFCAEFQEKEKKINIMDIEGVLSFSLDFYTFSKRIRPFELFKLQ